MKKIISILCMVVMLMGIMMVNVNAVTFSDLDANHWAYTYITALADKSVINGFEDGTYRPNDTVTKGQFVKLVMAACIPSWMDLSEVETTMDHWAAKYIKVAETYSIIQQGEININNVNDPITRIEMVKIISLADIIMFGNEQQYNNSLVFKDSALLNLEELSLIQHASSRGLVTGYEDNTFRPDNNMTRAEAATMIYRFTK